MGKNLHCCRACGHDGTPVVSGGHAYRSIDMPSYTTLITPAELQTLQAGGAPLLVFDCSFDLAQPDAGAQLYHAAHIFN